MSISLLKQSLEIMEASSFKQTNCAKEPKGARNRQNPFAPSSSKNQLPEYRAVKKIKQKAKQKVVHNTKQQHNRSAIEHAHDAIRNNQNKAEENLKKLLMLSSVKLDENTTQKLIRRAQNKQYVVIDEKRCDKEQGSVFTDEDFAKFENEYFVE